MAVGIPSASELQMRGGWKIYTSRINNGGAVSVAACARTESSRCFVGNYGPKCQQRTSEKPLMFLSSEPRLVWESRWKLIHGYRFFFFSRLRIQTQSASMRPVVSSPHARDSLFFILPASVTLRRVCLCINQFEAAWEPKRRRRRTRPRFGKTNIKGAGGSSAGRQKEQRRCRQTGGGTRRQPPSRHSKANCKAFKSRIYCSFQPQASHF